MSQTSYLERLAVCSWSLQPATPAELIEKLREIGILRIQCALDPLREKPAQWSAFGRLCAGQGVSLVSGMFGCVGEDYSTMESIRRTGGLVPDATWPQNWENLQSTVAHAADLGLKLITFHAGFIPHEATHPDLPRLLDRIRKVADLFGDRGIGLSFETGQETADTLLEFLQRLERKNVGVNFDPANMILYDKGDPIEALRTLGPWVRSVHLKDATKTKVTGTWGKEVPVGTGEVDWKHFFATLRDIGFKGDLCFEREAGTQRVADIRSGHEFIRRLLSNG
jgi:L-ribulose-5-phosphate 3-epimerase